MIIGIGLDSHIDGKTSSNNISVSFGLQMKHRLLVFIAANVKAILI